MLVLISILTAPVEEIAKSLILWRFPKKNILSGFIAGSLYGIFERMVFAINHGFVWEYFYLIVGHGLTTAIVGYFWKNEDKRYLAIAGVSVIHIFYNLLVLKIYGVL